MSLDRDAQAREEIARQETRLRDIRWVVEDATAGRRSLRAALALIAELALGEADRTVRIGSPHNPEVNT